MLKNSKKLIGFFLFLATVTTLIFTSCNSEENSNEPYYYNEENKQRYEEYQKKNPDLEKEEVIWRVEADIDKVAYKENTKILKSDEEDDILLINKHFALRKDYIPKNLEEIVNGQKATSKTVKAYKKMAEDAKKEGLVLNVRSGYRSIDLQNKYYNNIKKEFGRKYADKYSSRPRFSEHHTGRALDLVAEDWSFDNFEKTESCKWLHENAWKYGFTLRYRKDTTDVTGYSYESWHVTYVGRKAAKIIHDENIKSLEEYWVKYVKYSPQK